MLLRRQKGRWLTRLTGASVVISEKPSLHRKVSVKKMQGWSSVQFPKRICSDCWLGGGPPNVWSNRVPQTANWAGAMRPGSVTAGESRPPTPLLALWTRGYNLIWLYHKVPDENMSALTCERLCLWNFKLKKDKEACSFTRGKCREKKWVN